MSAQGRCHQSLGDPFPLGASVGEELVWTVQRSRHEAKKRSYFSGPAFSSSGFLYLGLHHPDFECQTHGYSHEDPLFPPSIHNASLANNAACDPLLVTHSTQEPGS